MTKVLIVMVVNAQSIIMDPTCSSSHSSSLTTLHASLSSSRSPL